MSSVPSLKALEKNAPLTPRGPQEFSLDMEVPNDFLTSICQGQGTVSFCEAGLLKAPEQSYAPAHVTSGLAGVTGSTTAGEWVFWGTGVLKHFWLISQWPTAWSSISWDSVS